MTLRIGLLGNAAITRSKVIPALKRLQNLYEIVAIGSRRFDKNLEFEGIAICQYNELVKNPSIDLIYIALPNSMHNEWVLKTLQAGKHVLCEKPFITCQPTLNKILRLSQTNSLCVRENFQFVHHSQSKIIRDIIYQKGLGTINLVRVDFGFPLFFNKEDIRYSRELEGGAIRDAGVYTIKFLNEFFADTWQPVATSYLCNSNSNVDIGGALQLRSSSGTLAQTFFSFEQDYVCRFEILGSKGRLQGDRIFTAPYDYQNPLKLIENNKITEIEIEKCDHFVSQLTDLYETIASGEFSQDRKALEKQAKLLDRCLRSKIHDSSD